EDEPRLLAVGQTELDELPRPGVDGRPGLDPARRVTLAAVPLADVAGVLVRDAALALDGVQEVDPVRRGAANRGRRVDEPPLLAGEGQLSEVVGHARRRLAPASEEASGF